MSCRKLAALLCAAIMALSFSIGYAEGSDAFATFAQMPDSLYYKGDVVLRGFVKGADTTSELLEVAYVTTSSPYIVLNQKTHWDVTISGGSGDYSCEVLLAYQEDLSMDQFYDQWEVAEAFYLTGGGFDYTFTRTGRYFWAFYIMDDNGQYLTFQTRIYEVYSKEDETSDATVAGKVNSIVEELITPEMSDYARALALHDWLVYNANYDHTYTHYDASGVLLYGTGVCDSYARAYLMLCTAAGLDGMILTGTAGTSDDPDDWEDHAWNLVKISGSWYHVDCTWDDPNEGGFERHDYFLVDDATLSLDHRWNRPDDLIDDGGPLPPEADGDSFWEPEDDEAQEQEYHFTFATVEEFEQKFDALLASGVHLDMTTGKYTGDDFEGMFTAFDQWCPAKAQALANQGLVTGAGCQIQGSFFSLILVWVDPTDFIRIDQEKVLLNLGEEYWLFPDHFHPNEDVFAWTTSNSDVIRISDGFNSNPDDDVPDGPYAVLTALKAGSATITASTTSDLTDSVEILVLPPLEPDFDLALTSLSDGVKLTWSAIPGATEYQVYRRYQGKDTLLASTADLEATFSSRELPGNVVQQVYVTGLRKVGDEVAARYVSPLITYGSMKLSYQTDLPDGLLSIGAEAFADNTSLTSVELPGSLVTIGERAFAGCSALTLIHIPASVSAIGSGAFDGCPLAYAVVTQGSYADTWLQEHCPDVMLIY